MSGQFLSILFDRNTAVAEIQHQTQAHINVLPILSSMEIRRHKVG
jgi:hypothetical protein